MDEQLHNFSAAGFDGPPPSAASMSQCSANETAAIAVTAATAGEKPALPTADATVATKKCRRKFMIAAVAGLAAAATCTLLLYHWTSSTAPAPLPPPCTGVNCGRFPHHHKWTAVSAEATPETGRN